MLFFEKVRSMDKHEYIPLTRYRAKRLAGNYLKNNANDEEGNPHSNHTLKPETHSGQHSYCKQNSASF